MSNKLEPNIIDFKPKVSKNETGLLIFDKSRKKFLKLTPEEFVRQFFIEYLVKFKQYPVSNIATEKGLTYNQQKKRADIIVYKHGLPFLLVECKAMGTALNMKVVQQISNYSSTTETLFLAITNGEQHYFFQNEENNGWKRIEQLPDYSN